MRAQWQVATSHFLLATRVRRMIVPRTDRGTFSGLGVALLPLAIKRLASRFDLAEPSKGSIRVPGGEQT